MIEDVDVLQTHALQALIEGSPADTCVGAKIAVGTRATCPTGLG